MATHPPPSERTITAGAAAAWSPRATGWRASTAASSSAGLNGKVAAPCTSRRTGSRGRARLDHERQQEKGTGHQAISLGDLIELESFFSFADALSSVASVASAGHL